LDYRKLQEMDKKFIWHPSGQMKDYETLPPMIIDRGEGVFLYGADNKRYIDIIGSWWCNLLGHCNPMISDAIKAQLDKLEHVIFANFSHRPAIEYASRLVGFLPKGLTKIHYNDCGSAAIEVALKMSFQYHAQTGNSHKTRFMCLSGGYHGETIGALSVGSHDKYSRVFGSLLYEPIRIQAPDCYRCKYNKTPDRCSVECLVSAEEAFRRYGKATAALIVEPILQGAAGMKISPPKYLLGLRKLCDKYSVHLIADEVATGFGRTGKLFACNHADITPDFMCLSKGISGGYLPFALVATTDKVYDAFYDDYQADKAFWHSHTYSGNPLGCAAAIAVLDILTTTDVIADSAANGEYVRELMHKELGDYRYTGDIRGIGNISALELVRDKQSKETFDLSARIGYNIYKKALEYGLMLRPLGNILYFCPPLNITRSILEESVMIMDKAIRAVLG